MRVRALLTLLLLPVLLVFSETPSSAGIAVELGRSTVEITAFYNGTTLKASGTVPTGTEAVIVVSGKPETLHLKRKGKVGNLLWMNVGDLSFDDAPRVYMIYTSDGARDAAENPELECSFPALEQRVKIEPPGKDEHFLFGEFLKLKKHDKVFASFPGAVSLGTGEDGNRSFETTLQIPPRMGQDDYTVTVFAVDRNRVVDRAETTLQVRQAGFPARLSKLAFGQALLYGVLSVLVAVAAGFIMGALFGGNGGAH